jgi:hypothetical protein
MIFFTMQQRWYDQDSGCNLLLSHIRRMPQEEVRQFAADLLRQMIEHIQQMLEKQSNTSAKSLGLSGLRVLYVAKNSYRRWYDHDPKLKKVLDSLYLLPLPGLSAVCFKLNDTFGFLALYGESCKQLGQKVRLKDLEDITRISLFDTPEAINALMQELTGFEEF